MAVCQYWLAATLGLQLFLAGRPILLTATFSWQPLLAGRQFWLAATYGMAVGPAKILNPILDTRISVRLFVCLFVLRHAQTGKLYIGELK